MRSLPLRVLSFLSLWVVWLLLAHVMGPQIVPGPAQTLAFAWDQFHQGALTFHLWATIRRVLLAFTVAMVVGVLLGMAMGMSGRVDDLLEAWVVAGLSVPRIMIFVVAYLMLGLTELAIVLALVLTIIPNIVVQVREGTRALDHRLVQMAQAFRRSRWSIWTRVVIPQLLPYILGTARGTLSIGWRLVVLGELLGRTSGVGYQIQFYFQMFNMTGILAYGLTMMVVLAVIDMGLLGGLERRLFRWRQPAWEK